MLPLGAQLRLADAIAALGWTLLPAMQGRVLDNVRHILGPRATRAEVRDVARQQWRNYLRYMRDFAALPHSAAREMEHVFGSIEGWEHIEQALRGGRGIVLVSAHFGNWDLAAGAVAQRFPVNVIADTFRSPRLNAAIQERRAALGLRVISIDRGLKRTASALRRNEVVGFLVDKPVEGDEGVEVRFFGQPVRIPAGAAYFASRLRAPIIIAFAWHNADCSYMAKVLPPIAAEGDMATIMQRIMDVTERVIRQQPGQWYMFRRMWSAESSVPRMQLEEAVA